MKSAAARFALIVCFLSALVCAGEPAKDLNSNPTYVLVSVLGSVNRPGQAYLTSNDSLLGAIAASGGWIKTANTKKVAVLHGRAGEKLQRTEYDLGPILEGQKENPRLDDGDIVYVPDRLF